MFRLEYRLLWQWVRETVLDASRELASYTLYTLLFCCIRNAATNQRVLETTQKYCDVYTSS